MRGTVVKRLFKRACERLAMTRKMFVSARDLRWCGEDDDAVRATRIKREYKRQFKRATRMRGACQVQDGRRLRFSYRVKTGKLEI